MAIGFTITSSPFNSGAPIPKEFTCDSDDVSPPLQWAHVPEGTESVALVVDDPDAPGQTFTHWVLFNLPADATTLPRDVDVESYFADEDPPPTEGANDFSEIGYRGPCPPVDHGPHRYFFRLYALDTVLDLDRGATRQQLMGAMDDHLLAETDHVGTYER